MYKFAKVKLLYFHDEPIHWYLLLESLEDLMKYLEVMGKVSTETYFHLKEKHKSLDHFSSDAECAVGSLFLTNNNNRKSAIDDLLHLSNSMCKPKLDLILKGEKLLIGENLFGFMPYSEKTCNILEIVKKEMLVFPEKSYTHEDIRVIKWPNGKHYYAKIGNCDVIIDDEQKWKTKKQAYKKALKFLELKA